MRQFLNRLFGRGEPVLAQASARDTRALAPLHAASFRRGWSEEEFERLLLDPSVLAHRAAIGRQIVGFIMARIAASEAEILSVAVDRSQRGRGVAQKLLRMNLGRLAGLGVTTVFLEVGADNEAAIRLYRRAGFREVGRREGYYPNEPAPAVTALVLRRDLA